MSRWFLKPTNPDMLASYKGAFETPSPTILRMNRALVFSRKVETFWNIFEDQTNPGRSPTKIRYIRILCWHRYSITPKNFCKPLFGSRGQFNLRQFGYFSN